MWKISHLICILMKSPLVKSLVLWKSSMILIVVSKAMKLSPSLDICLLRNFGMGGPNVNLSFQRQLISVFTENYETAIIKLGTCPLHKVNTAFGNTVARICKPFDVDQFAMGMHFFCDFAAVGEVIDVMAKHLKMASLQPRGISILGKKKALLDKSTPILMAFLVFVAKEFNAFIITLQALLQKFVNLQKSLNCKTSLFLLTCKSGFTESFGSTMSVHVVLTDFVILPQL